MFVYMPEFLIFMKIVTLDKSHYKDNFVVSNTDLVVLLCFSQKNVFQKLPDSKPPII